MEAEVAYIQAQAEYHPGQGLVSAGPLDSGLNRKSDCLQGLNPHEYIPPYPIQLSAKRFSTIWKPFCAKNTQILVILSIYAVVIGVFSLIVPLTVQELVNTFAFAIQPIMISTVSFPSWQVFWRLSDGTTTS